MSNAMADAGYILTAGYVAVALLLGVDLAAWCIRSRHFQASAKNRRSMQHDVTEFEDIESDRHASGCPVSGKIVLSGSLSLGVLGLSIAELIVSHKDTGATSLSHAIIAEISARIVWAALTLLYLAGRAGCQEAQGAGAMNSAVSRIVMAFLGVALMWRVARLVYVALRAFPSVKTLLYLEGLCATGSLGAVSAVRSLQTESGFSLLGGALGYSSLRDQRDADPLGSAGWMSILTFAWLNPLFATGASRQLQPTDLPQLAGEDRSSLWAERFDLALKTERKLSRPSLVRACRVTFGREFLSLGWLKAASTGIGFSGPLLLKVVVNAVQDGSGVKAHALRDGYLGAAGLAACYALSAILDTQFCLRLGRLQVHIRAAVVSAVYRCGVLPVKPGGSGGGVMTEPLFSLSFFPSAQVLNVRSADAAELDLTEGSATNLIAVDQQRLVDCAGSLHELWGLPLQIGVTFYLLHREVAFAFAAGLVVIMGMIPLNAILANRIGAATRLLMVNKDDRVERSAELLHSIRAVKMFAWEGCMRSRIDESRDAEVSALSTLKYVDAWCVFLWATTPTLVCLVTFATLVVVRGERAAPLEPASVFAAVSLLRMLIHPMNAFPWVLNGVVEANISKGRLERLLLSQMEEFSCVSWAGGAAVGSGSAQRSILSWKDVTVSRHRPRQNVPRGDGECAIPPSLGGGGLLEPLLHDGQKGAEGRTESEQDVRRPGFVLRNVDLDIMRGEAVALVGEVGSGKSTLIEGILGELPAVSSENPTAPDHPAVVSNLDEERLVRRRRPGGVRRRVCYAAQRPWVMGGTVRDNVLFGMPMDEGRYREVLEACALHADLAVVPGGDLAFVGERGATLSGGQRLRVSLARCAYSASAPPSRHDRGGISVLCLLDDPLSALDATTRNHISNKCIHGLLRRNPDAAVIVACGEVSPSKFLHGTGENATVGSSSCNQALEPSEASGPGMASSSPSSVPSTRTSESSDAEVAAAVGVLNHNMPSSFDRIVTLTAGLSTGTNASTAICAAFSASSPRKSRPVGGAANNIEDFCTRTLTESTGSVGANASVTDSSTPSTLNPDTASIRIVANTATSSDCNSNGAFGEVPLSDGALNEEYYGQQGGTFSREKSEADRGGTPPSARNTAEEVFGDSLDEGGVLPYAGNGDGTDNSGPVDDEERKDGSVEFRVYLLYVRSAGFLVAVVTLLSLGLMQASSVGFNLWLSYWATHQGRVSVSGFLISSFSIAVANAGFTLLRAFGFAYGGIRAAVRLHRRLLTHVLRKNACFYDVTPSGRVVNRFSRDAFSVDDPLPFHLNVLLAQAVGLMATAVVLSATSPLLLVLFLPLGVVYGRLQRYYRRSSRELRRLFSTSRSPMYALFAETLDGAVTIRAFEQEDRFFDKFMGLLAANQRATFASSMASAWLSLRLQALGVVVIGAVAFLVVAQEHIRRLHSGEENAVHGGETGNGNSGLAGLSLTYALPIVGNLTGLVGALTETEREMISVERMDEYCRDDDCVATGDDRATVPCNEQERTADSSTHALRSIGGRVSQDWPMQGRLEVSNVVMRYRRDLRPSLAGVALKVDPGEKVGIVGRTGCGKSSLLKAIFRLYAFEGTIAVDGVDISTIPVRLLRSRLAVIPQEPLLFRGTVRENLDPSREHTDAALWQALRSCSLAAAGSGEMGAVLTTARGPVGEPVLRLVESNAGMMFGLETRLDGHGSNVSAGQRQLLCVARALLRGSKLVCIDEATSTMDETTAEMVDATMMKAFRAATVVTVAHRLPSVLKNCDSVAVMSEGRIIERGSPSELASDVTSAFSALLRAGNGAHK